ncbi:hypothetical protein B5E67_05415 [Faecalibacterium sp. An122]|nr:hypothetical protein B5E67_05415 [Faecalibacterium sp. An122]
MLWIIDFSFYKGTFMKILQMNCWLNAGSTGKIVHAIDDYIKSRGDDSYVVYGLGDKSSNPNEFRTTPKLVRKAQSFRSRITGYPYGGCIWGTSAAVGFLKKTKPDLVHIHCINGYMVNIYKVLSFLKENKIPTVITNHAEFMYTGGCTHAVECEKWKTGCFSCKKLCAEHPISYFFDQTNREWNLMKEAYFGFEKLYVCNVSDWLTERARQSLFYKGYPVETVYNGVDTEIFHYTGKKSCEQAGVKRPLIIHVTPNFYDKIKGGHYVIEMGRRCPEMDFLVIGSKARSELKLPPNIRFMGQVSDQSVLAQMYSNADVCLLTSMRETFSMVTAESLCCGTPVVGFEAGGPESIALKEYSIFVDQGNVDAMENALRTMVKRKTDKERISNEAACRYSKDEMCQQYYKIYKKLIGT